jgi:regulator of RNase E activity RraA
MQDHARFHWPLPVVGEPSPAPSPAVLEQLSRVSAATACAQLNRLGVRRTFIEGPRPMLAGQRIVGPALTLQFMPQREDIAAGGDQEYIEKHTALWKVFDAVQPGHVLVIQAFGAPRTGCLGEMLLRYFRNQGGAGVVLDGRVRDAPKLPALGVPIWSMGVTPHYASQDELFPWAYNVPIACGGVLVLPTDLVIADDDGVVIVPGRLAEDVITGAAETEDWESFSRRRIDDGGRLDRYYPLDDEGRREFQEAKR